MKVSTHLKASHPSWARHGLGDGTRGATDLKRSPPRPLTVPQSWPPLLSESGSPSTPLSPTPTGRGSRPVGATGGEGKARRCLGEVCSRCSRTPPARQGQECGRAAAWQPRGPSPRREEAVVAFPGAPGPPRRRQFSSHRLQLAGLSPRLPPRAPSAGRWAGGGGDSVPR